MTAWPTVWLNELQAIVVAKSLVELSQKREWVILRAAVMSNHVQGLRLIDIAWGGRVGTLWVRRAANQGKRELARGSAGASPSRDLTQFVKGESPGTMYMSS